jgi:hypothetical protein
MSTSRPMALCRATDDPTSTPLVATGSRHGCPFGGRGLFSPRRRIMDSTGLAGYRSRGPRLGTHRDAGTPARHDRAPGWSPATSDRSPCTADGARTWAAQALSDLDIRLETVHCRPMSWAPSWKLSGDSTDSRPISGARPRSAGPGGPRRSRGAGRATRSGCDWPRPGCCRTR